MSMLNLNLQSPQFLYLLALLPVLVFLGLRFGKHPTIRFSSRSMIAKASKSILHPDIVRVVLYSLSFIFLVVALAGPRNVSTFQQRKVSGVDIVMVLDVSLSMLIQDMGKKDRMEVAKQTFSNFVRARSNDRIGLVVFAGEPLTLAPPTLDYDLLQQQIRIVEPGHGGLREGTAIGDGLALGIQRLKESTAKSRVIVLLTDGDSNVGKITPMTAAELAKGYGIKTYTIGFGSEGQVRQPFPQKNSLGQTFYIYQTKESSIDNTVLVKIADMTGGKFYRAKDESGLRKVFNEIDQLETSDAVQKERVLYEQRFMPWVWLAFFMLFIERSLTLFYWRLWS